MLQLPVLDVNSTVLPAEDDSVNGICFSVESSAVAELSSKPAHNTVPPRVRIGEDYTAPFAFSKGIANRKKINNDDTTANSHPSAIMVLASMLDQTYAVSVDIFDSQKLMAREAECMNDCEDFYDPRDDHKATTSEKKERERNSNEAVGEVPTSNSKWITREREREHEAAPVPRFAIRMKHEALDPVNEGDNVNTNLADADVANASDNANLPAPTSMGLASQNVNTSPDAVHGQPTTTATQDAASASGEHRQLHGDGRSASATSAKKPSSSSSIRRPAASAGPFFWPTRSGTPMTAGLLDPWVTQHPVTN
ncbi:uncharacterized protein CLUP02_16772 [Colletotrichum lupini]|uniref:Uncharacterized protein n=1 Tax=Colletotrichum lupini TaxID=145971 RepID=A0A9Q8WPI4_9PEZI|nr:uncharacterized protein CLUP02_16772 [Colletotrichum lupini]UQC91238.1 hypothetical protein CLUP02_16772 [Colletotrichum lupini]